MTLDMEDPQIDYSYATQNTQPPLNESNDYTQSRRLVFAGEEGFPTGSGIDPGQETLYIKPAEAARSYEEANLANPPGMTLNPTGALTGYLKADGNATLSTQNDLYSPLKPTYRHRDSMYDETYDFMGYDDKFPCESYIISKMLAITIPTSSFFIAVAYFMTLFYGQLTYSRFWNVFIFVALHTMVIVAGFKAKSFLKWCYKNCRILIRRHYILFVYAITVQCYYFYFAKDVPLLLVGSSFVIFSSALILVGLIIWVVGLIRRR